jgi:uncharacterized protein (TIGR00725 family)
MTRDRPHVGVAGSGDASTETCELAEALGRELADRGAIVVCGGLDGVMEAACRGARSVGGTTIGILPGECRNDANPYVDVAIPTGLGEARNALLVRAVDVLIAVEGEFGTLSEIALALRAGKPVVGLHTWELSKGGVAVAAVVAVHTPKDAAELALDLIPRSGR